MLSQCTLNRNNDSIFILTQFNTLFFALIVFYHSFYRNLNKINNPKIDKIDKSNKNMGQFFE